MRWKGDLLMNGADQVRRLGVVEFEGESGPGVGFGAAGFFHALGLARRRMTSSSTLVRAIHQEVTYHPWPLPEPPRSNRRFTMSGKRSTTETPFSIFFPTS